jgi:hypothetical protein
MTQEPGAGNYLDGIEQIVALIAPRVRMRKLRPAFQIEIQLGAGLGFVVQHFQFLDPIVAIDFFDAAQLKSFLSVP